MATPHPPPVPDSNAIAALQTAADASSTPYQPSCSRAVAALQFSASTSVPSLQRSGTYTDPNSPINKCVDAPLSPQRRVTTTNEAPRAMEVNGTGYGQLHFDEQHPTPHPNATAISHSSCCRLSSTTDAQATISLDPNSGIIHHRCLEAPLLLSSERLGVDFSPTRLIGMRTINNNPPEQVI
jgi:hypothetical protein